MKYRKKPVVIEAREYNLDAINHGIERWCGGECVKRDSEWVLLIPTLEGVMTARVGDYIIKGVQDEYYPCKPDIFEETYEKVEE